MGRWSIVLYGTGTGTALHCTVRARGRDIVGGVGCAMLYSDRTGYGNGKIWRSGVGLMEGGIGCGREGL